MRALKIIGLSLVPAVLICGIFWLGGWDFERGFFAAYIAVVSIVFGSMVATIATGSQS